MRSKKIRNVGIVLIAAAVGLGLVGSGLSACSSQPTTTAVSTSR